MMSLKKLGVAVIAVTMVLLGLPSLAQAECKGMSKSACERASQCSYVKGYTTKSGSKVAAYCRNKAKKGASSTSSSAAKTSSKDKASKADKKGKTADKKKASKKKDAKKKDSKNKDKDKK